MTFCYADPPYPGLARRYYDCDEVDHVELVRRLVEEFPDGWALSTGPDALDDVLAIVRRRLDLESTKLEPRLRSRTAIWVKGSRKGVSYSARNAYEPLIVCGGRAVELGVNDSLDDVLVWGGRQHTHPDALVGMKPAAFCEWMFRLLGATRGDQLVDLFPGSGSVSRAWELFTGEPAAGHLPSRLAGAQRLLDDVIHRQENTEPNDGQS
jgi:hypothetical protein